MKIEPVTVLDENVEFSLRDICRVCDRHTEWIVKLVEVGVLDPVGKVQEQWRFPGLV